MRADECTLVTLNALLSIPLGNHNSGAALLVSRSTLLPLAVDVAFKGRNRQAVAVHTADGLHDVADLLDQCIGSLQGLRGSIGSRVVPALGDVDLMDSVNTGIDSLPVHLDNSVALLAVALLGSGLHVLDGIVDGHDVGQLEEGRLQDGVGALAHADLDSLIDSVDGVQLNVVVGNVLLVGSIQVLIQLGIGPLAVDHKDAARLDILDHLHAHVDVSGVMAGNEVSLVDVVGAADGLIAKAQMADGNAAGLLGVILEVSLNVLVGMVANDLGGVLVCADSAVAAETPELALFGAGSRGDRSGLDFGQAQVGDVIGDADGEARLRISLLQFGVDGEHAGRRGVLGAQAVTAAGQDNIVHASFTQGGGNIQVQGFAQGAGLLGAVQNCDLLCGLGQNLQQSRRNPRTIQTNQNQANLLALSGQVVNNFFGNVADGAHSDDDAVCIGSAVVVEQVIVGAQLFVDLGHVLLDNCGQCLVCRVAGFTMLEENVAVFVRTAHLGMFGVQSLGTELLNSLHVAHFLQVFVIPLFDLLDLVRSTEAVEEVHERNMAFDSGQVSNGAQIHNFLRVGFAQHGKTGLTNGHNVAVVTEDVQGLGSNGTGGNVKNAGQLLGCDFVHVGDHQQKTLRSGEGGGDSTGAQRTVHSTCGASLGLHFNNLDLVPENVLQAGGAPLVNSVCHRAGGGNRVDGSNIGKRISYMRSRGIAIHGLFCSWHFFSSVY